MLLRVTFQCVDDLIGPSFSRFAERREVLSFYDSPSIMSHTCFGVFNILQICYNDYSCRVAFGDITFIQVLSPLFVFGIDTILYAAFCGVFIWIGFYYSRLLVVES